MTDRELMQQALEALEWNLPVIEDYGDKEQLNRQHRAITDLRERLAQPDQWQGLTDEERTQLKQLGLVGVEIVEAKLKEKNGD